MIVDAEATKPQDWDEEEDGEWEPPQIKNPKFKGTWKAKKIANPAYKGKWEVRSPSALPRFLAEVFFGPRGSATCLTSCLSCPRSCFQRFLNRFRGIP